MAKEVFDILLDDNDDLVVKNGDIVIGESTEQHIKAVLIANKGEFRDVPFFGVGLNNYLKADGQQVVLKREIEKMMTLDGMQVNKIQVSDSVYEIEGFYK